MNKWNLILSLINNSDISLSQIGLCISPQTTICFCCLGWWLQQLQQLQRPSWKLQPLSLRRVDAGYDYHCTLPDLCQWSVWSAWTVCAEPCSGGVRQRFRRPLASPPGPLCKSQQTQSQSCNTGLCPGTIYFILRFRSSHTQRKLIQNEVEMSSRNVWVKQLYCAFGWY